MAQPPPPPWMRMGTPASRQLTIEVSGLRPETLTTTAVPGRPVGPYGVARQVLLLSLQRGCEYVPCFEAV